MDDDEFVVFEPFAEFSRQATFAQAAGAVDQETGFVFVLAENPETGLNLPPTTYEALLQDLDLTAFEVGVLKLAPFYRFLLPGFYNGHVQRRSIRRQTKQRPIGRSLAEELVSGGVDRMKDIFALPQVIIKLLGRLDSPWVRHRQTPPQHRRYPFDHQPLGKRIRSPSKRRLSGAATGQKHHPRRIER